MSKQVPQHLAAMAPSWLVEWGVVGARSNYFPQLLLLEGLLKNHTALVVRNLQISSQNVFMATLYFFFFL